MAFKLDYNTLDELGLGSLPDQEEKNVSAYPGNLGDARETQLLASQMSEAQLDEFEVLNAN